MKVQDKFFWNLKICRNFYSFTFITNHAASSPEIKAASYTFDYIIVSACSSLGHRAMLLEFLMKTNNENNNQKKWPHEKKETRDTKIDAIFLKIATEPKKKRVCINITCWNERDKRNCNGNV